MSKHKLEQEKSLVVTEDKSKKNGIVKETILSLRGTIFSYIGVGVVSSALVLVVFLCFFDSPKETMLRRELAQYETNFNNLKNRLDVLDTILLDIEYADNELYRVALGVDPIPEEIREGGIGGSDASAQYEGLSHKDMLADISEKLQNLELRCEVEMKSLSELYEIAVDKNNMLKCVPAIKPVREVETKRIASYYGYRTDPIYKIRKFHRGIDFSAPIGTEILATGDGVITKVHNGARGGYGRYVEIDHGYSYTTLYAHMNKIIVKKGQKVKRGQVIGYVGNSGKSSGSHLHYEVLREGKAVDPIQFFYNNITPDEYEEMIRLSAMPGQSMD